MLLKAMIAPFRRRTIAAPATRRRNAILLSSPPQCVPKTQKLKEDCNVQNTVGSKPVSAKTPLIVPNIY